MSSSNSWFDQMASSPTAEATTRHQIYERIMHRHDQTGRVSRDRYGAISVDAAIAMNAYRIAGRIAAGTEQETDQ